MIFITTHILGEMDEAIGKNYIHHVETLSDAALIINLKVRQGKSREDENAAENG